MSRINSYINIADLYIRVSTDEQADKGYSQRAQEELLRKYCELHGVTIRKVILEDHSAKTFDRPAWKKYLLDLRKNKNQTDAVMFLKWDRFSRNAGDAYQMINTLRKLGVEPQAIEQPLDLSIPENKMMLAFYLAAPEVENDRRALNVIHGMRRARKEGRYMGLAPYGYTNKSDDTGRRFIAPLETEANIVRWAFTQTVEDTFNTEQIYHQAKQQGFFGSKSLFWSILRNPVYCGKIFLSKYKDEDARLVDGKHEALISEGLFYQVQDVLDGRKREPYKLKVVANTDMPLRGFLICPVCSRMLTGSASKGCQKHYSYYHCVRGCKCRFRTDLVNSEFEAALEKYVALPEFEAEYNAILLKAWNNSHNHGDERRALMIEMKAIEERLSYARDLMLSKQLDPADFKQTKADYTQQVEKLEAKLADLPDQPENIELLIKTAITALSQLTTTYKQGTAERKRLIISSIYPEKLSFDGSTVRTTRINDVAASIYLINKKLQAIKKPDKTRFAILSGQVGATGLCSLLSKA